MTRVLSALILPMLLAAAPAYAQDEATGDTRDDAQAAYVAGDLDRAQAILGALVAQTPDDADLLRRLAAVEAAQGDLPAAKRTIDKAIALAPQDPDVQLARANILLWQGRLDAAEQQANAVTQSRPGYPGADAFAASLQAARDSRKTRLNSIDLSGTVSDAEFASGRKETWYQQVIGASVALGKRGIIAGSINREERAVTDTRFSLRTDLPDGDDTYFLAASVTPNSDFREKWRLAAGGQWQIAQRTALTVDGSYADYSLDDVATLGVGIRQSFNDRVAMTARTIHLFGGGETYRIGGSVRGDYAASPAVSLFAIAASYPDTEVNDTRQLRSVAAGAVVGLNQRLSLRVTGEYDNRDQSYERTALTLGLSWRFGR